MNKVAIGLAMLMAVGFASAQDPDSVPPAPGNTAPPLLQKPYEAARDFFNYYALANVIYDSNAQFESSSQGGNTGVQLGGGINGYHQWATGQFGLSYRGTYRDYFSNSASNGTDQYLVASAEKRFKHWTIDLTETGGILFTQGFAYGTGAPNEADPGVVVQANPASTQNRFTSTSVSATYIQNYRLSYTVSGSYILQSYNSGYSVGSNDTTAAFSTQYRLTKRTSIGGTYSHGLYQYRRNNGSNNVDSVYLTVSHDFLDRIQVSASAGGSRSSGAGAIILPLTVLINGTPELILAQYHYKTTNYLPYYALSASKLFKHTSVIVSATESITPGNGQFLTSRSFNLNGLVVHELKRSNFSFGGYLSRMSALSTGIGATTGYTSGIDGSFSYNLLRHVGLNARYDYLDFSNYGAASGRIDNRVTFGVYFESKDVPLGLF